MKSIVFDIGNVLLTWNPREVVQRLYPDQALCERIMAGVFEHADWIEVDRGALEDADAIPRFSAHTGRPHEEIDALLLATRVAMKPIEPSLALARELARTRSIYGLSNMSKTTFAFLHERHSFWRLFRGVVISGEIGMVKPDENIFRHLAERFGLVPQDTVFIDDHAPNIVAAARLGYHAIHFRDARECRDALAQLLEDEPCT